MARFDVNLAPLEIGNPFCEAKSELKFFEAALVDVPTVASPTGPMLRAIRDGETSILAADELAWRAALLSLVDDHALRRRMGRAAGHDAMRLFGPLQRARAVGNFLAQLGGARDVARSFELEVQRAIAASPPLPRVPDSEVMFESDRLGASEVTVIVPLYNYAHFVVEALTSVRAQTLAAIDLVVIDDASKDESLKVALDWAHENAGRFNRLLVLRNRVNSGLALTRNVGFDAAETPFVLPLDADNRLLPNCCMHLLAALRDTDAAFAYPIIRRFGEPADMIGHWSYIRNACRGQLYRRHGAGGERSLGSGWRLRIMFVLGGRTMIFGAVWPNADCAAYRYRTSWQTTDCTTYPCFGPRRNVPENKRLLLEDMNRRHPWLMLAEHRRSRPDRKQVLLGPTQGNAAALSSCCRSCAVRKPAHRCSWIRRAAACGRKMAAATGRWLRAGPCCLRAWRCPK